MKGQLPNPEVIAGSVVDGAKAVVGGGVGSVQTLADGVKNILMEAVKGGTDMVGSAVNQAVGLIDRELSTGKSTVDGVRSQISQAINQVQRQVDRGAGQEVVRKFKSSVESYLP